MDKAKAAVSGFLSKDGKHETTVHETVNPAVTNETVNRTHHEKTQTAIDREVHQDHYHTSVQPIQHREVLPEQHSHNMVGVEHRQIKHGDDSHVKERLAAEGAQFKNARSEGTTQHTTSQGETIAGEHVHHHVHENIQPVIQKETIQPSVVHTTIPVHEVHQNEAKHHTATQLPPVTLDDFKRQGGSLSGREERTDAFAGEPKAVGGTLGGHGARGTTSLTENDVDYNKHGHGTRGTTGSGLATNQGRDNVGTGVGRGATGTGVGSGTTNTGVGRGTTTTGVGRGATGTGVGTGVGSGATGTGLSSTGRGADSYETGRAGHSGSSTGTAGQDTTSITGKKPSLLDRLNPMKDSDHDGKKGFND